MHNGASKLWKNNKGPILGLLYDQSISRKCHQHFVMTWLPSIRNMEGGQRGSQLQNTLLHWKTSPSSNWTVMVPTGSSWIERPQNLLFKLLSPQHFHPRPSQWQARIIGWWLTFLVSPSRSRLAYLEYSHSPLSLVNHVLVIYKVSSWTNLQKLLITEFTFAKFPGLKAQEVRHETDLFWNKTHTHVRKICLISLTKQGIERFTGTTLCWGVPWDSKCSYAQNPHKTISLHTKVLKTES